MTIPGETFLDINQIDWEEISLKLKGGKGALKVKDRWKGMKKTSNCFLGNEMVDWICTRYFFIYFLFYFFLLNNFIVVFFSSVHFLS